MSDFKETQHGRDHRFGGSDFIPPGRWIYVGDYPGDADTTADSPPFLNGWGNVGGGARRMRFRLTNEYQTEIEGEVSGGASGTAVVNLAALYRPDEDTPAPGVGGDWVFQADGDLVFTSEESTFPTSLPPSGAAGGVLDGTYPNPGLAAAVAGAGLAETTNVLSVNVDGSTIEISSDTLRVKDDGITAAKIATDAVGSSEIAANAVGSSELADNAVDTAAIQDGAVTVAKLSFDPATQAELDAHITDATDAHAASAVSFTPTGTIAATDVQAAIAEVASEAGTGGEFSLLTNGDLVEPELVFAEGDVVVVMV